MTILIAVTAVCAGLLYFICSCEPRWAEPHPDQPAPDPAPIKGEPMIASHLRRHWHHHLALWGSLAALTLFLAGLGAGVAAARYGGGFHRSPLPPRLTIGGEPLPWHHSLGKYITRVHNQGSSNSCVGQTLSEAEEIVQHENHRGVHYFSAGFIYDQCNGGVDEGSTYDCAFSVLVSQGDAPLRIFPHDGIDYLAQPDAAARDAAASWKWVSFRSIAPSDIPTMEYELAHGRPIAIAMPWHDTLYNHFNTGSTVTADDGTFHFWHSTLAFGYNRTGLDMLNSWGPSYGTGGRFHLAWNVLVQDGAAIAVSQPVIPATTAHHPARANRRPQRTNPPLHRNGAQGAARARA